MIAKLDPVTAQHFRRISTNGIHDHYLGLDMQNESIGVFAKEIREEIINRVKKNKYFILKFELYC